MRLIYSLPRLSNFNLFSLVSNHTLNYSTPINLNYGWSFGSLIGLYLVFQVITGILLVMFYTPHSLYAFMSTEFIMRDVNYGWLIRYLHANIASFIFIFLYMHMARGLYYTSYANPRKMLWYSGIIIFSLMMAIAFMGYVLPWGQMSYWGATVITNLFSAIPYIGTDVACWLWGGFAVDSATLTRFFSLHYLLPFVVVVLVLLHLYFLHIQGSSNPLGLSSRYADRVTFIPYFYVKDIFVIAVSLIFLFSIVCFSPNLFGHPDNYIPANPLITPTHIVPEWYFLYFYAILRTVPNKLGGVICMVMAIIILVILVWVNKLTSSLIVVSNPHCKFYFNYFFYIFIFTTIAIGWIGGQVIEFPYTQLSILLTISYFSYIFIWLILLNIIDFYIGYDDYESK